MSDYLNLKGFDNIFETTLNNELQDKKTKLLIDEMKNELIKESNKRWF